MPNLCNMDKSSILFLNLYDKAFNVMFTGEKNREYRKPSRWMDSRIYNKDGSLKKKKYAHFTLGYNGKNPYFLARILYIKKAEKNYKMSYSNGLKIDINKGDFIIRLGKIIEVGNIDSKQLEL